MAANNKNESLVPLNATLHAPIKLTPTNYITWKLQFTSLLAAYDLLGYVDGSYPCPAATIPKAVEKDGTKDGDTDAEPTPNPARNLWIRQDSLILHTILGSLTTEVATHISHVSTAKAAWDILAASYAAPSRGRVKQIKFALRTIVKGNQSVSTYLQAIRTKANELAMLGAPMDADDLMDHVLANLGEEYTELVRAVQARDTLISFEELHEKLLNFEASLQAKHGFISPHPTALVASPLLTNPPRRPDNFSQPYNQPYNPSRGPPPHQNYQNFNQHYPHHNHARTPYQPRPYLGKCQLCGTQGHGAKRCPTFPFFQQAQNSARPTNPSPRFNAPPPRAHHATTQPWLLDTGASHHMTSDFQTLNLHDPYHGSEDIMIGDGSTLPITHTGPSDRQMSPPGGS